MEIRFKRVDADNLESEHICCAIGDDKENRERAMSKKTALATRFAEGHVFLKADVRGKVFIEYGPAEFARFPVDAPGWTMIQCFWVSGKYKDSGLGTKLLDACEADSKKRAGVFALAASKGKKPFLSDGNFLAAHGYEIVDEALGFALFAKSLKKGTPTPKFIDTARSGKLARKTAGVDLFYSDLCPFTTSVAAEMAETAKSLGHKTRLVKIGTLEEARALRAPPGIFQVYLNGSFLSHELMTPANFEKKLKERLGGKGESS